MGDSENGNMSEKEMDERTQSFPDNNIEKIVLISNILSFGLVPSESDEIEQRLSITKNGIATLSHWNFSLEVNQKFSHMERKEISIETTNEIFKKFRSEFDDFSEAGEKDCGEWKVSFHFSNGQVQQRMCSIGTEPRGFSKYLRKMLPFYNMFALDGK